MRNASLLSKLSSKNYFYQNILYGLARQAKAHCRPNPAVAAMILHKDHCISWGITQPIGGAHAEIVALDRLKKRIGSARLKTILRDKKNTSMLVTLSPCHFHGRTPPCTNALVSAGLKHIVIAHDDSHVKVKKKSLKYLKSQGLVIGDDFHPQLKKKLLWLNYDYLLQTSPTFTIKYAMTADGKMATRSGHSNWITSEMTRRDARYERACHDAVMIGAGTFFCDNPYLDIRGFDRRKNIDWEMLFHDASIDANTGGNTGRDFLSEICDVKKDILLADIQKKNNPWIHPPKPPWRIVFFSRDITQAEGKKLLQSHLLSKKARTIFLIAEHHSTLQKMCDKHLKDIEVEIYPKKIFQKSAFEKKSSPSVLRSNFSNFIKDFCRRRDIHSLFLEGGAKLQSSFLETGLCDRLLVYLAPKLLGDGFLGLSPFSADNQNPADNQNRFINPSEKMQMSHATKLKLMGTDQIGEDIKLSYLAENAASKKVLKLLQL